MKLLAVLNSLTIEVLENKLIYWGTNKTNMDIKEPTMTFLSDGGYNDGKHIIPFCEDTKEDRTTDDIS